MSKPITAEETLEYLPLVKRVAFVDLNQTMYELDVGGLMFVGERPPQRGSCYVKAISYHLFDEDEYAEAMATHAAGRRV